MTTPFESLDDAFNTTPTEEVVSAEIVPLEDAKPVKKSKVEPANKVEDREKDYQYARGQLYDVVEKMQEILNGAMEVAAQSDHPRAYEVAFNGAKHVADAVEKLQDGAIAPPSQRAEIRHLHHGVDRILRCYGWQVFAALWARQVQRWIHLDVATPLEVCEQRAERRHLARH